MTSGLQTAKHVQYAAPSYASPLLGLQCATYCMYEAMGTVDGA